MTTQSKRLLLTLAPYLPHDTVVEHPLHGRGVLVGLPATQVGECAPVANVRFDNRQGSSFPDWYELASVKPVLYDIQDWLVAATVPGAPKVPDCHMRLPQRSAEDIQAMAAYIDWLRALGIALNLPESSYCRREVARV